MKRRIWFRGGVACLMLACGGLVLASSLSFRSPEPDFRIVRAGTGTIRMLDRHGIRLGVERHDGWNRHDILPLYHIPEMLGDAFVIAEDQRFYQHHGVDWLARGHALWQMLRHRQLSRGASTITEQVVRMLHPRPRTLWAKWMEGLEAIALEQKVSKPDILEFYLNQVPYAANRRGVVQAARYYFNRDIETLNPGEMLALVVLVRAPSAFDLYKGKVQITARMRHLADKMVAQHRLDPLARQNLDQYALAPDRETAPIIARAYADYVASHVSAFQRSDDHAVTTTLDAGLQQFITDLLAQRLKALSGRKIGHAAAIVIDHTTHDVLAWVSVGRDCAATRDQAPGCQIDLVTTPRQPGSALKPFLYAAAIQKGWDAATIIEDAPYADTIGRGIKHFRNYSNVYYGKVRLRTALGNSLNIPALHTINYVTPAYYLSILHDLGFSNLRQNADFYDDGLALGNGEVSLLELARGYTMLANRGVDRPPRFLMYQDDRRPGKMIFSEDVTSLIGNILSDPWARNLEFGRNSVLNLPTQTAVKTGTSSDYRDAWAMGYNYRYTVGIWMGNADYTPMDGVTGSVGPALALRSIFNELTRDAQTAPLYLSPRLEPRNICIDVARKRRDDAGCPTYTEYFPAGRLDQSLPMPASQKITILRPAEHLDMAFDPRIPPEKQLFEMRLAGMDDHDLARWQIDDHIYPDMKGQSFMWPITKGQHTVQVTIMRNGKPFQTTDIVHFRVK